MRLGRHSAKVKNFGDCTGLPHDLIVEILLRLPAKSLGRFRIVCKLWNSLTYDPSFVDEHQRRRAAYKSIMCFIKLYGGLVTISRLHFDGKVKHEFTMSNFEFSPFLLSNIVNGLACLHGYIAMCLLNITTRESVMLPIHNQRRMGDFIASIGYSTCTNTYKLVRQNTYLRLNWENWHILTLGANEWRPIKAVPDEITSMAVISTPVFLHGALHWSLSDKKSGVLVLDMNDETFEFVPSPASASLSSLNVVELDRHICLAGMNSESGMVEIWKLNPKREWTKEYNIHVPLLKCEPRFFIFKTVGFHDGSFQYCVPGYFLKSYDLQKKNTTDLVCQYTVSKYFLYTESLVSPKKLCISSA